MNEFKWKFRNLNIPKKPGVYLMRDGQGTIVYVGKAASLKNRISSYFHSREDISPNFKKMRATVQDLEVIITDSEAEALILENNLIKRFKPKYNVQLKDAKTFPFVKITNKEKYPRFIVTRDLKDDGSVYYGPYTDVKALRSSLHYIRKFFPVAICSSEAMMKNKRPCLEYHIKRCTAPCTNLISENEYSGLVDGVRHILEGRNQKLTQDLHKKIEDASSQYEYEKATTYRNQLRMVEKIVEKQKIVLAGRGDQDVIALAHKGKIACAQVFLIREGKVLDRKQFILEGSLGLSDREISSAFVKQYYSDAQYLPEEIVFKTLPDEVEIIRTWFSKKGKTRLREPSDDLEKDLVNMVYKNAVLHLQQKTGVPELKKELMQEAIQELQQSLGLVTPPNHIEGFDISNIQGRKAVGSVVVFMDGEPLKKEYRKFKIKSVKGVDDYAMIREVVERRYKRIVKEGLLLPDLILIDGGKGHLSTAREVLLKLGLENLAVVSLAKENEEIFTPTRKYPIKLPHNSQALFLAQRVRDEAHRFAIKYHHILRRKTISESVLDQIPGVGPITKRCLLTHFGNIENIRKASSAEIARVDGVNHKVAKQIYRFFKNT